MLSFWTVCYYQMDCSTPSYLKYFKHSMLHGMSRWLAFYQRRVKQGAWGLGPTSLTRLEIKQSLGILQYSMPQILKSKLHQKSYMSISFPYISTVFSASGPCLCPGSTCLKRQSTASKHLRRWIGMFNFGGSINHESWILDSSVRFVINPKWIKPKLMLMLMISKTDPSRMFEGFPLWVVLQTSSKEQVNISVKLSFSWFKASGTEARAIEE